MKNMPTEKSVVSIQFGRSRRGTKEYLGGHGLPGGIYPCSIKILLNYSNNRGRGYTAGAVGCPQVFIPALLELG